MKNVGTIIVLAAAMGTISAGWAEDGESAYEPVPNDAAIRVSLGSAPGVAEGDLAGFDTPVDDDGGGQLEVLWVKRYWKEPDSSICGVFGGGLFFSGSSGK